MLAGAAVVGALRARAKADPSGAVENADPRAWCGVRFVGGHAVGGMY